MLDAEGRPNADFAADALAAMFGLVQALALITALVRRTPEGSARRDGAAAREISALKRRRAHHGQRRASRALCCTTHSAAASLRRSRWRDCTGFGGSARLGVQRGDFCGHGAHTPSGGRDGAKRW